MSLDFPTPAVKDQLFDAPNGITYIYDGVKWTIKVTSDDIVNYWSRNAVTTELAPKSFNDTILFSKLGVDQLNPLP